MGGNSPTSEGACWAVSQHDSRGDWTSTSVVFGQVQGSIQGPRHHHACPGLQRQQACSSQPSHRRSTGAPQLAVAARRASSKLPGPCRIKHGYNKEMKTEVKEIRKAKCSQKLDHALSIALMQSTTLAPRAIAACSASNSLSNRRSREAA